MGNSIAIFSQKKLKRLLNFMVRFICCAQHNSRMVSGLMVEFDCLISLDETRRMDFYIGLFIHISNKLIVREFGTLLGFH